MIRHRDKLGRVLTRLGLEGPAAEIGVNHGRNATLLLSTWKGGPLHLVDPWETLEQYEDVANNPKRDNDYKEAMRRLERFTDRIVIHRMMSNSAAKLFERSTFDCVYIDANHAYEAVRLDIALWYPLVKPGGLIGGHDYHFNGRVPVPRGYFECGVKRAVDEFVNCYGLQLTITNEFKRNSARQIVAAPSWFVRKDVCVGSGDEWERIVQ